MNERKMEKLNLTILTKSYKSLLAVQLKIMKFCFHGRVNELIIHFKHKYKPPEIQGILPEWYIYRNGKNKLAGE